MAMAGSGEKDFSRRLRRIEKAHRKGYGFEASGTMGRSTTWRRPRSPGRTLRIFLLLILFGWVAKGAILFTVGETTYQERVAGLAMGNDFDPIAASIMSADPVTKLVASFLAEVFPPARGPVDA